MTSRQNYDCLYSPLLRWCAKRALIPVPIHDVIPLSGMFAGRIESLLCDGKSVIGYYEVHMGDDNWSAKIITAMNYTTLKAIRIYDYGHYGLDSYELNHEFIDIKISSVYIRCSLFYQYLSKPHYRKYLHKNALLALTNIRSVPFVNNFDIRKRICGLLDVESMASLYACSHLSGLFV